MTVRVGGGRSAGPAALPTGRRLGYASAVFGSRRRAEELQRQLDEARDELELHASSPLDQAIGRGVVLHLDDRRSIAGVLTGVHADEVTLEAARLLVEGAGAIGQDGTIAAPRKRIAWYQIGVDIDDARLPA
jgi:hypothetical protein